MNLTQPTRGTYDYLSACLAHELLSLGLPIVLEDFAGCKDQNELCVRNIFSKEMTSVIAAVTPYKVRFYKTAEVF